MNKVDKSNNSFFFKKYIKSYFWSGLSLILNMLSMMIIIPLITDNQEIYAIYTLVISISIFLSYADLGFISASIKYGGEAFINGKIKNELSYYGFTSIILFGFILLIAISNFYFSYNPLIIFNELNDNENILIAKKLFFIQGIFSFSIIFNRYIISVFQVRIEKYIYDRISIIGSFLKLISVYYYFVLSTYDIVGYFLFLKLIDIGIIFVGFYLIYLNYNISIYDYLIL